VVAPGRALPQRRPPRAHQHQRPSLVTQLSRSVLSSFLTSVGKSIKSQLRHLDRFGRADKPAWRLWERRCLLAASSSSKSESLLRIGETRNARPRAGTRCSRHLRVLARLRSLADAQKAHLICLLLRRRMGNLLPNPATARLVDSARPNRSRCGVRRLYPIFPTGG